MLLLDKYLLRRNVRTISESEKLRNYIPGMDEKLFNRMVKIMAAQDMSEIEDISTEEVMELFDYVNPFAEIISANNCFNGKYGNFYTNLQSLPSIKNRRVL